MELRAGWDATFSAPKSVSLTALVGGDDRAPGKRPRRSRKTRTIHAGAHRQCPCTRDNGKFIAVSVPAVCDQCVSLRACRAVVWLWLRDRARQAWSARDQGLHAGVTRRIQSAPGANFPKSFSFKQDALRSNNPLGTRKTAPILSWKRALAYSQQLTFGFEINSPLPTALLRGGYMRIELGSLTTAATN